MRNLVASLPAREHIHRPRSAEKTKPDLYVLAIGIDDYRDPGYTDVTTGLHERAPPLTLAVRDARAFADAMRRAGAAHYQHVNVTLALNSEATRDRLDAAVFALAKRVHPRDTFILYVAAHGRSHNGHFYIIPQDYRGGPNAVMQQGIGQETIQDWIANRVRAKKALVLIDACEAGALIAGHTSSRTSMPLSEAAIGRLHEATGRPVLTATAAGQFAVEGYKGHGVFTFAVLDALRHADGNGNGTIELSELAAHVQSLLPKLAPELDDPTIQQPRFGSRGEDFVIAGRLDD
jgi:uncharacterized caspase-like protein